MSTIERRTDVVTIYPGDYLARIRHLERLAEAAQDAADRSPQTMDESAEYLDLAREHDELVREAESKAVHVKLQALPRRHWKALCAKYPPRVADATNGVSEQTARADAAVGVNEELFKDALVYGDDIVVNGMPTRAQSILEPDLSHEDIDDFSDADFDRIYLTAFALNRGVVADPKASLVSRMTPKTDET